MRMTQQENHVTISKNCNLTRQMKITQLGLTNLFDLTLLLRDSHLSCKLCIKTVPEGVVYPWRLLIGTKLYLKENVWRQWLWAFFLLPHGHITAFLGRGLVKWMGRLCHSLMSSFLHPDWPNTHSFFSSWEDSGSRVGVLSEHKANCLGIFVCYYLDIFKWLDFSADVVTWFF